jgi:hypothetical protein
VRWRRGRRVTVNFVAWPEACDIAGDPVLPGETDQDDITSQQIGIELESGQA